MFLCNSTLHDCHRYQPHQIASHVDEDGEDVVIMFFLVITSDKAQEKGEDEYSDDEQRPDT
jgi:hypothetical protein